MKRIEVKINSKSPSRSEESYKIVNNKDHTNNSSTRQREAMQKLATSFKKKSSERKESSSDTWKTLLTNILNSQRGRIPLLLAVESGNQSMVRELLSSQTAEQLRVNI